MSRHKTSCVWPVPSAFMAASFAANRPAKWTDDCLRARQYVISPSVKMRLMNRSPYRSRTLAIRGMSVASRPRPMI